MSTDKPQRILRNAETLHRAGFGQTTRDNLEKQGLFPKRVQLGPRCVGWIESEVDAWIAERARARDGADDKQRASA